MSTLDEDLEKIGITSERLDDGIDLIQFKLIGDKENIIVGIAVNELVFKLPGILQLSILNCFSEVTNLLSGNNVPKKETMQ